MRHVFIIGSKSIGQYGGFETFVSKLIEYHKDEKDIRYHIACKANGEGCMDESTLEDISAPLVRNGKVEAFTYRNARVRMIRVPNIGPGVAIWYDCAALDLAIRHCEKRGIRNPIFYVLACRIGPFIRHFKKRIRKIGGKLYVNPDGHEWKRTKWSPSVRKYWKMSEELMVKSADLLICDSLNIEKYIHDEYGKYHPETVYIAYGAETNPSPMADDDPAFLEWLERNGVEPNGYYLVVGRFVPENNYDIIIREFMRSRTDRKLVLITNENEALMQSLDDRLSFSADERIQFAGPEYNPSLLRKIRENAYAYIHGHEVGGTNPSLLEALGSTNLNLLLDVGFNREVAESAALYWTKESRHFSSLSALIDYTNDMDSKKVEEYGRKAKERIQAAYSWDFIASEYRDLFLYGKKPPKIV